MSKARQIVFTDKGEEALDELKELTGLNNSQAVTAALKIARIVMEAQNHGSKFVIENSETNEKTMLEIVA
ncbi:MAG: hypothetical protein JXR18_12375 [Neptuniibacter sp.]